MTGRKRTGFSKGTNPGGSGLHAQHLLDAVTGHTSPSTDNVSHLADELFACR